MYSDHEDDDFMFEAQRPRHYSPNPYSTNTYFGRPHAAFQTSVEGGSSQPTFADGSWQDSTYQPAYTRGYAGGGGWKPTSADGSRQDSIYNPGWKPTSVDGSWRDGAGQPVYTHEYVGGGSWKPTSAYGSWQDSTYQPAYTRGYAGGRGWKPTSADGSWQDSTYQPAHTRGYAGGGSKPTSVDGRKDPTYQPAYTHEYAGGGSWKPTSAYGSWQDSTYQPAYTRGYVGGGSWKSTSTDGSRQDSIYNPGWKPTSVDGIWRDGAGQPVYTSGYGYGSGLSTWQSTFEGGRRHPTLEGGRRHPSIRQPIVEDLLESYVVPNIKIKETTDSHDGGSSISAKSIKRAEIIVDPDGESSWLCSGCRLPIFSTPSVSFSGEQLFMHEQCAFLPPQWLHELHPEHGLVLINQLQQPPPPDSTTITCHNCNEICGTMLYQCPHPKCDFRLDLSCILQIKILHRSHHHTMMVIRLKDSSSLTCSACDNKHESESQATLSYLCNLCGFWIHPDCASLPNAILHYEHHNHSLFLTFNILSAADSKCVICSTVPKRTSGVYFCLKCPNYLVHIRCALTRPKSFKPVFIRDAKVADLGRLPLPDEHTSLIPYMREHIATTPSIDDHYQSELHPQSLILHKIDDDGYQPCRVCNACVQFVSPPFFSCSHCPDFFLHSCCANLSSKINHSIHKHPLILSPKAPKSDIFAGFSCKGCDLRCNGFAYSCQTCDDFSLDVVCASITPAITHDSHKKTHILFMSRNIEFESDQMCNCCNSRLNGICYECSICCNFKLHVRCALLPNTVRHVFDEHPLQLITTPPNKKSEIAADDGDGDNDDDEICEVCEEHIKKEPWNYNCYECNQSFHVDCIPSVDRLSKIKLGSTVRVDGHGCPIALIRQDDVVCGGRRCGICGEIFEFCGDAGLAYECSKCFFGIHQKCAEKCLIKS